MQNQIYQEDMSMILSAIIPWEKLRDTTVFITGATGLIGCWMTRALLEANREKGLNIAVHILARNVDKARILFDEYLKDGSAFKIICGSVESMPSLGAVDYIIHGASQTASLAFINQPVETIMTAIDGTKNVLESGKRHKVRGMLYLSSMEVYGCPPKGVKIFEDTAGMLTTMNHRNCYPLSKAMCENLCCSYYHEFGVPAKVVRLTQTFGPGVAYDDRRVFAEFARNAIEHKDILLKTKGETERSYLYVADAVTAMLTILLRGNVGEAYNAANEGTYCSIADMASMVARLGGLNVLCELQDVRRLGYSDVLYMDLSTKKLQDLGWKAKYGLQDMFTRMMATMQDER